jgi:hypothetical protein
MLFRFPIQIKQCSIIFWLYYLHPCSALNAFCAKYHHITVSLLRNAFSLKIFSLLLQIYAKFFYIFQVFCAFDYMAYSKLKSRKER